MAYCLTIKNISLAEMAWGEITMLLTETVSCSAAVCCHTDQSGQWVFLGPTPSVRTRNSRPLSPAGLQLTGRLPKEGQATEGWSGRGTAVE